MTVGQRNVTFRDLSNKKHSCTKKAGPVLLDKTMMTCCRYDYLNTTEAISFSACLENSVVQVVQDQWRYSNGRFIATVTMQLRKRAVSLCHQELKEYKVPPQHIDNELWLLVMTLC